MRPMHNHARKHVRRAAAGRPRWDRNAGLFSTAISLTLGSSLIVAAVAQADKPTVALVRADQSGIAQGTSETVNAQCPGGYDVLGGSAFIGGTSAFAHIASAAPITDRRMYQVKIINPLVNPFAGIPDADASVTVGAICAQSGKPVVVDGQFGKAKGSDEGHRAGTVKLKFASDGNVENNTVSTVNSTCPRGYSVFSGGYAIGGSPWAHASGALVSSRINAFTTILVNPPFDPSLGILKRPAAFRALSLCSETNKPLILSSSARVATAHTAKAPKRKRPEKSKGNVVLVKRELGGIKSGSVETLDVKCPQGYTVFAGSYTIGDSAVAHATGAGVLSRSNAYETTVTNPPVNINGGLPRTTASVTVGALCAKNGKPIVIDPPFPQH
jgi:hypothetical protein